MDGIETIILIGGEEIRVAVFSDKILFLDEDGQYEQRLDISENLKGK